MRFLIDSLALLHITISPLDASITEMVVGILRYCCNCCCQPSLILTETDVGRATPVLQAQVSVPPCSSVTGWETGWRTRTSARAPPTLPLSPLSNQLCLLRSRRMERRWSVTTVPGHFTELEMDSLTSTVGSLSLLSIISAIFFPDIDPHLCTHLNYGWDLSLYSLIYLYHHIFKDLPT